MSRHRFSISELQELIDRHGDALQLFARQWCSSPEDAVQEAFIALTQLESPPRHCDAWLFATVRRRAMNLHRSERRRAKHHSDYSAQQQPWFDEPDTETDVERLLCALAETEREIVIARIWGELTWEQVAELVGKPLSTVHRKYHAAIAQMQQGAKAASLTSEPSAELSAEPALKKARNQRTGANMTPEPNRDESFREFEQRLQASRPAQLVLSAEQLLEHAEARQVVPTARFRLAAAWAGGMVAGCLLTLLIGKVLQPTASASSDPPKPTIVAPADETPSGPRGLVVAGGGQKPSAPAPSKPSANSKPRGVGVSNRRADRLAAILTAPHRAHEITFSPFAAKRGAWPVHPAPQVEDGQSTVGESTPLGNQHRQMLDALLNEGV